MHSDFVVGRSVQRNAITSGLSLENTAILNWLCISAAPDHGYIDTGDKKVNKEAQLPTPGMGDI